MFCKEEGNYAAKGPGTYTVIVEGSDMKGNVGSKIKTIIVQDKEGKSK